MQTMTIVWLAVAVVMAIAEAATVQLVSLWFVAGAVAACVTSLITDNIVIQIVVFVAVTAAALIVTRPLVKKIKDRAPEPTNSDRCIGKEGTVVTAIDNSAAAGQVRVGSSVWSSRSEDDSIIPAGTRVVVTSIEGVKLIVKPL